MTDKQEIAGPDASRLVEQIQALIGEWRADAIVRLQRLDSVSDFHEGQALHRCANQLEALLAAQPEPTVEEAIQHANWKAEQTEPLKSILAESAPTPSAWQPGQACVWWVCFRCWIAYYVPTTGYYGDCPECKKPTQRWPADPSTTLAMTAWRRSPLPTPPSADADKEP